MDDISAELTCAICLEYFKEPIILPCSHVLCKSPCAERLFLDDFVRCPVCRDESFVIGGIDSLPRVISLENIIERLNRSQSPSAPTKDACNQSIEWEDTEICREGDIPCQLCEGQVNRANRSCLDCHVSYCMMCLRVTHPKRPPFTEHRLVTAVRCPAPPPQLCARHGCAVSVYCLACSVLGCLLCIEQNHPGHQILSLDQAVSKLKEKTKHSINLLEMKQRQKSDDIDSHNVHLEKYQRSFGLHKEKIDSEFQSLMHAVEAKREFFLSDLDYEERNRCEEIEQNKRLQQSQLHDLHSLMFCAKQVLKETQPLQFMQLANEVNERINATLDSQRRPSLPKIHLKHKMVDLRSQCAFIREITYVSVPSRPEIEIPKCSRSTTSIVLVLAPWPKNDIVDGFVVYYTQHRHLPLEEQDQIHFETPEAERGSHAGGGSSQESAICLIQNNLVPKTAYYFTVHAYNMSGQGDASHVAQCSTLSESTTSIPVPEIKSTQCRCYTHSIQISSASPTTEAGRDSNLEHFLLFRQASETQIWKSVAMYDRTDHRVFNLAADTSYELVVMTCSKDGRCQVSNKVTLKTESAVY